MNTNGCGRIIAIIGLVSGCIAIFVFFTGLQTFRDVWCTVFVCPATGTPPPPPSSKTPDPVTPQASKTGLPPQTVRAPVEPQVTLARQSIEYIQLGNSAGGRSIRGVHVGNSQASAVVIVGSIEGDQANTRYPIEDMINEYDRNLNSLPEGGELYLFPTLNPDGNANTSRYNAHGVDLNRNWGTYNWRSDPAVPGHSNGLPGAGGQYPFSEPETIVLRDWLLNLRNSKQAVYLIVIHASVKINRGQVLPGYTRLGVESKSAQVASLLSSQLGYDYSTTWEYETTGEAIGWAAENSISAVDLVFVANQAIQPSDLQSIYETLLRQ